MAAIGAFGAALAFPLAANAAPLGAAGAATGGVDAPHSNVIAAQYAQRSGRSFHRAPRSSARAPVVRGGRVVTRGGYGYWGGHRGYRYARPGYRYYNGWWFPAAAFGAILGGAIASQAAPVYAAPGPVGLSPEHYAWCEQRYISYRASDNSFQPYQGPRQACVSPYS